MLAGLAALGYAHRPHSQPRCRPALRGASIRTAVLKCEEPARGRERYVPAWVKRDAAAENIYAEARSEYEEYARILEARDSGKHDEATRDPSPPAAPPTPAASVPPSPAPCDADEATRDASPPATPPTPPTPTPVPHEDVCSALEPLAASLAPLNKTVVECGDGGTCGPNSLGCVLSHARLHNGSGEEVRRRVVAHAAELVRAKAVWCKLDETSVRELIESSFATWALPGCRVNRVGGLVDWGGPRQVLNAENWLKLMASPTTWIDEAFLTLAADCFAVDIRYSVVSGSGEIRGTRVVEPRETVDAQAEVELAYVVDRHFCAIVPTGESGIEGSQTHDRDVHRRARSDGDHRRHRERRRRRTAERPPKPTDGSLWWLRC